jgi:hypothetical protein
MADNKIQIQIDTAINSAQTAQNIGQLKNSLIELQNIAEKSDLGAEQQKKIQNAISQTSSKMADLKGKVGDIQDTVRTLDGSPFERMNNSVGLLGEGVRNLDLDKVKTGIIGIGKAVMANPLGLLITAVSGLITLFGAWDEVLGFLKQTMDFLLAPIKNFFAAFRIGGDDINYATQRMDEFNKSMSDSQFQFDKNTIALESELALMRERGATAVELAEQERKISVAKSNFLWEQEKRIASEITAIDVILNAGRLNGKKLTNEQIADYEKNRLKLETDARKVELELEKNYGTISVLETKKTNAQKIKSDIKYVDDKKELAEKALNDLKASQQREFELVKERLKSDEEMLLSAKKSQMDFYTEEFIAGKMSYETLQAEKVLLEREYNEKLIELRENFRLSDAEKIKVGLENSVKLNEENQQKISDLTSKNLEIDANLKKQYNDSEKRRSDEDAAQREKLRQQELESEKKNADDLAKYKKEKEEEALKNRKEIQDASFELTLAGLNSISTITDIVFKNRMDKAIKGSKEEEKLAKKQFEINKALQLGTAVINGIQSILAITSVPDFTFGVQSALRIGAQVVLNAASIAKIAAQKFSFNGSAGSSGSTTPSTITSTPTAQTPTFQPTQFFGLGQTVAGVNGGQSAPTRVYVTEGDISNTQNRVRVVENRARFG